MSLPAGTELGSLQIVRPLGAGGMGEVYLAQDRELNRQVAVKVLPANVTPDTGQVARFEREARAASALNHPNVCVIHALGRTGDGRRFIAMEYVEGETLRERLRRGRPPLRDALDVAIQIAAALTAAHAAGIVHRDIKPENVSQNSSFINLWRVRFDPESGRPSGAPSMLTHIDSPGRLITLDGGGDVVGVFRSRVVLTMATATGNIWMLENADR